MINEKWNAHHDWECGPGWDHYITTEKGRGNLDKALATNLSQEVAEYIVRLHNRRIELEDLTNINPSQPTPSTATP